VTQPDGSRREHGDEEVPPRLAELASLFGDDGPADVDELDGPVHWPSLSADLASAEWESLRTWLAHFVRRFPTQTRIPECWWQHNELVEAFAALRDYERASFASTAPATAAVEWHRAFRDMESRWENWIKRFRCSHDPTAHDVPAPDDALPPGWDDRVAADAQRRRQAELAAALRG